MALTTQIKDFANRLFRRANLRLDTLTAERLESRRLLDLAATGYFEKPAFPLLPAFQSRAYESILAELPKYRARFDSFANASANDVGYTYENGFYTSPDAEVLYTMVRQFQPRQILEIGCGNSTRISRQAIIDGKLSTRLVCIDPCPRTEIRDFADEINLGLVEKSRDLTRFAGLSANDILFIDSSHEVRTGNDVVFLLLNVLPQLPADVIVHVHDIFLPFEYPEKWVVDFRWNWTEQYILQAMLAFSDAFEVIWPGHHLHRTCSDFAQHFPNLKGRTAQSLWLRKLKQ